MKRSVFDKISTGVLWGCILVTLILSVWFYGAYYAHSIDKESPVVMALLDWLFILLVITVSTALIFSFFYVIRQWKENPKRIRRFVVVVAAWGLLLSATWLSGNGTPLSLIGYKGNENTYLWLKITDMWLYSIYILSCFAFLALLGGIIWSYFKKGS